MNAHYHKYESIIDPYLYIDYSHDNTKYYHRGYHIRVHRFVQGQATLEFTMYKSLFLNCWILMWPNTIPYDAV